MKKIIGRSMMLLAFLSGVLPASVVPPPDIDFSKGKVKETPPLAFFHFDRESPGTCPTHLTPVGIQTPTAGNWHVQADERAPSLPNVLVENASLTPGSATDTPWTAAFVKDLSVGDADMSVKFKISSASASQCVGFIYRYHDAQNYDVVGANADDNSLTLVRVTKGKSKVISEGSAIVTADLWHTLRVVYIQNTYRVFLEDEMILAGSDPKGLDVGALGLAVRGETKASFDDFVVNSPAVVVVPPNKSKTSPAAAPSKS